MNNGFSASNKQRVIIITISIIALLYIIPYFLFPGGWFGDDCGALIYAIRNIDSKISNIFLYKDDYMLRYRPLTQTLVLTSYKYFGLNTILIRTTSYIAFLVSIIALTILLRTLRVPNRAVLFSIIFFAIHPIKSQALFRPARPEIYITALGVLSLLCLDKLLLSSSQKQSGKQKARSIVFASLYVCLMFCALFFSELAVCFLLVSAFWIPARLLLPDQDKRRPIGRKEFAMMLIPFAIGVVYLLLYTQIGDLFKGNGGRYQISFGFNIIENISISMLLLISPISTAIAAKTFYGAAGPHELLLISAGFVALAIISFFVLRNLKSKQLWVRHGPLLRIAAVFLCCTILCLFPFVIVRHVSEVYLTHASAFFCMGIGVLLHATIGDIRLGRNALKISFIILLALMMISSMNNFLLLRKNSTIFQTLYSELLDIGNQGRGAAEVYLFNREPLTFKFSQYYLPICRICRFSDGRLYQFSDGIRPTIHWVKSLEQAAKLRQAGRTIFEVNADGHLRVLDIH